MEQRKYSNKRQVNFYIDKDIANEFAIKCKLKGLVASMQIELMIKEWLKKEGKHAR